MNANEDTILHKCHFYVGFRSRRLPAPKAQIYSRFVNKLFSNVPRVIKKYVLLLTRAIIYLQGVSGFRSRRIL